MFSIFIDATDLRRAGGQWASFAQIYGAGIDQAMQDQVGPMLIEELTKSTPMSDKPLGRLHAADQWGFNYEGSYGRAGLGTLQFTNTADYLKYILSGTSPHFIDGNPLAFWHPGTDSQAYAQYVWHPGLPENDFVSRLLPDRMPIATAMVAGSIALSLRQTIR